MKTKQLYGRLNIVLTLLFFSFAFCSNTKSYASCQAGFTWQQSANNTIDFVNTTAGMGTPAYYWHFGDGNNSHLMNPSNFYAAPGIYWVCLTVYDSGHACNTFCDSVIVIGTHHCHLNVSANATNASCGTCADGSISLSISNGTAPYLFSWSNGSHNHYLSGVLPGAYSVCVTDSNNCQSCDTVHVANHQSVGSCHATFSIHADANHPHHYWAVNTATGTSPLHYLWSWGDGSYDTIQFPGHGYASPGLYTICLTISDTTGCTDSICFTHQLQRSALTSSIVSIDVVDVLPLAINNPVINFLIEIYPNPSSDFLNIKFAIPGNTKISVTDILGQQIFTQQVPFTKDNLQINTSRWNNGIYFITLHNGSITDTQKIIVQHQQR